MSTDRLTRLRSQHTALQAKVRAETNAPRQQMLLAELIAVAYALECANSKIMSRPSFKGRRRTLAQRRAEAARDFAGALARYAPRPTAARPAPSSAPTTARV
ncbi:hypothetical protein HY477_02725 [Candidatus Uhrbacteria bacterium]|nr:hypothetical protein [Candidatus Uhrbacteria bacterium]